jgi:RNA polymerase sigma-70 factor (ECF subfamily)
MLDAPALQALAAAAARGDAPARAALFREVAPRLVREVLGPILRDGPAVEDALAESFAVIFARLPQVAAGEVMPYVAEIARNKALDRRRKMASEGRLRAAFAAELTRQESYEPGPDALLAATQARSLARERIDAVLAGMHPRYAEAIRRRLLRDEPREACAIAMDVKLGTFDVLFFRACKQFRAAYVERYGEEGGLP